MPNTSTSRTRVAEFLRQWGMMRDKSDVIYGVLADPEQDETADLLVSDLRPLLEWWTDHHNLALTARFMDQQGYAFSEILYMLERPDKHSDDFNLAQAEQDV